MLVGFLLGVTTVSLENKKSPEGTETEEHITKEIQSKIRK